MAKITNPVTKDLVDKSPRLQYIFAQADKFAKIREEYCQLLDELFPDALDFLPFKTDSALDNAHGVGPQIEVNAETLKEMTAAKFLQIAYPRPEYDQNGNLINNRQQNIINTFQTFNQKREYLESIEFANATLEQQRLIILQQAADIIAACDSIATVLERWENKLNKEINSEDEFDLLCNGDNGIYEAYPTYLTALQQALAKQNQLIAEYSTKHAKTISAQQHTVANIFSREQRTENWLGRMQNFLAAAIDTVASIKEGFMKACKSLKDKVLGNKTRRATFVELQQRRPPPPPIPPARLHNKPQKEQ